MATKNIIIAGDLFPVDSNLELFCKGEIKKLFGEKICDLFAKADFRICNLEGALTENPEDCLKTGRVIKATPKIINTYTALGIDLCTLANNHITDGGSQGVADTIDVLNSAKILNIGAGLNESSIPHYKLISFEDLKVCVYNVCERMYNAPSATDGGAWIYDELVVCKELESLKKHCDHIIVIYHGGVEKFQYASPETRKRFHRMADAGAGVILSQHTHCIGCEEYYQGAYLLYGQGNFLFKNFDPVITDTGLLLELEIGKESIKVKKHKVKTENDLLDYDKDQDLTDFDKRSALLSDEAFVLGEFKKFCYKELRLYLTAYEGLSFSQRLFKRFFRTRFTKWLYQRSHSTRDLLFTLHSLRSEQNRETAITGLEELIRNNLS